MDNQKILKRLNYFRGFLATDRDLNDGENYHVERRRQHNRMMHSAGVCGHYSGGLRVTSRGQGMSIEISPGFAVDGLGREIHVPEPVIRTVHTAELRLPAKIWVTARFCENLCEFIEYDDNPVFRGHKRVAETCEIEICATEPDNIKNVELAAIELNQDVRVIKNAADPDDPQPGEIDLRFVPRAGTSGSFLQPGTDFRIRKLFERQEEVFGRPALRGISSASDVRHLAATAGIILLTGAVDREKALLILKKMRATLSSFSSEAEADFRELSRTREFTSFKWNIENQAERGADLSRAIDEEISLQMNAVKALGSLFLSPSAKTTRLNSESDETLDALRTRSATFEENLAVADCRFRLVDTIDVFDDESEKRHRFAVCNERDCYRSRQQLKYPDGQNVEDVGIHFEGGSAAFDILGVEPDRDILLIARTDVIRGNFECEVTVNGRKTSNLVVCQSDLIHRWRNAVVVIPSAMVNEPVLRVSITPIRQDRDVNLFTIWAYQQIPDNN